MRLLNLILNLAALLLWLNWRSIRFASLPPAPGVSLVGTLRRAEAPPARSWTSLGTLFAILLIRGFFYHQVGALTNWTPSLELGAVALPFRSDRLGRILAFSFLDFGLWLGGLYAWMLLLSAVNRKTSDLDPLQRMVRWHLGWLDRAPAWLKLFLPFLTAALAWWALHPLFVGMGLVPPEPSGGLVVRQALVLGASTVLGWKYLFLGLLALHILNSYLYLGTFALWQFATTTVNHLLQPLRFLPLRLGKIDLLPFAAIAAILLLAQKLNHWLPAIYRRL